MKNIVWTKGTSGLEGEFQSSSEVDFYINKDMIHIADTKVARRYGDFFIRQIHKFEEVSICVGWRLLFHRLSLWLACIFHVICWLNVYHEKRKENFICHDTCFLDLFQMNRGLLNLPHWGACALELESTEEPYQCKTLTCSAAKLNVPTSGVGFVKIQNVLGMEIKKI